MIYHVFANRTNAGDWLSARGIQQLLGTPVSEHLCDDPFVDATLERLRNATPEDHIVIGGGGLFMDYFGRFWEGLEEIVHRVPTCVWGAGYCDWKRRASRAPGDVLERVLRHTRLCIVRDELTRRHLHRLRLRSPVPCPSMNVLSAPRDTGFGLLHADNYTAVGEELYEATCQVTARFAAASGRPLRRTNNILARPGEEGLADVLSLYAASDIVVSSRLHGCIIAVAMGKKVIAVSGDFKLDAFMAAAGLEKWVCSEATVEQLEVLLATVETQPSVTSFAAAARTQNTRVAAEVRAFLTGSRPCGATAGISDGS